MSEQRSQPSPPYGDQPDPYSSGEPGGASRGYPAASAPGYRHPASPAAYGPSLPARGNPGPAPYPEHPRGTLILVLGILGFVATPCAPVSWYLGNQALREMRASGLRYANEQNVAVGRMLGLVMTVLTLGIVGLLAVLVLIVGVTAAVLAL